MLKVCLQSENQVLFKSSLHLFSMTLYHGTGKPWNLIESEYLSMLDILKGYFNQRAKDTDQPFASITHLKTLRFCINGSTANVI